MTLIHDIMAYQKAPQPETVPRNDSLDSSAYDPAIHQPEMLLIACVDARKDPIQDLGIPKGKSLILRNISAFIRGPSNDAEECVSEAAALEFAVTAMKVKHIAVMGHTDCGGIRASVNNTPLPHIKKYLSPFEKLKDTADYEKASPDEKICMLENRTIRASVENLMRYPFIADAVTQGRLSIHGWLIDITTGKLKEIITKG